VLTGLIDENVEPKCTYCSHGKSLGNDEVACVRRGVMSSSGHCRGFRYEPTKREPRALQSLNTEMFSKQDFSIDDIDDTGEIEDIEGIEGIGDIKEI